MPNYPSDYFHFKSIRDPLYGFIDLSKIETEIIGTPAFLRLHHIKQLSHAYMVYPTAVHTRFEHSLGVTHLADLVSKQLSFDDETREVVRLAGLLHDVGHGPFSHLFESVMETVNGEKIDHDKISMMIIKENPDIAPILAEKGEKIIQLLDHKQVSGWDEKTSHLASAVVSGPLDVDKMDYLRRDSYHIGVTYGQFDLPRIIHTLTKTNDETEQLLCVESKGRDAVENYRLGRYLMHAQVYNHRTRLICDQMFLRALDTAVNEGTIPKQRLRTDTDLSKSHKGFLDFYMDLNDHSIYDIILKGPESVAAQILNSIKRRKLLKQIVDCLPDTDIANAQKSGRVLKMGDKDRRLLSTKIAEYANIDSHSVIVHSSVIPIILYEGEIMIMWKGMPKKLDDFSPIRTSKSAIHKFYVFGPDANDVGEKIRKYVQDNLGIKRA